jgi:hypothetical protein
LVHVRVLLAAGCLGATKSDFAKLDLIEIKLPRFCANARMLDRDCGHRSQRRSGESPIAGLVQDDVSSNRHRVSALFEHDRFRKPGAALGIML